MPRSAILLIHCPDQRGIVAGISGFLYTHGANILHADQHQDNDLGLFFMRVEWDLDGFALDDAAFRREFQPLAASFDMLLETGLFRRAPRGSYLCLQGATLPARPAVSA